MNAGPVSDVRAGQYGVPALDVGEIFHQPEPVYAEPVLRQSLAPEEELLSLPPPAEPPAGAVKPLTRFLGPSLTTASPAWSADPVPGMRALQKKLIEHSLALPESERAASMEAVMVVEKALFWRLRLQQMRMSLAEQEAAPDAGGTP